MAEKKRYFNVTGLCNPAEHYMVNLDSRLAEIKEYVDRGDYFVINRARQHGKTTTLNALQEYLSDEYIVVSMDFQVQMSEMEFSDQNAFSLAFADAFTQALKRIGRSKEFETEFDTIDAQINRLGNRYGLVKLFQGISAICAVSPKPIVLMIDEVDSASNNQVFLDFLAQLRGYYLQRHKQPTFQSVILAGVHDIRNLRQKIRPDEEHKHNSPWNIAADFSVDMSFSPTDIAGMLTEYENDTHTGMDIAAMSQLIYDYTSGYPVLVSMFCKLMDEKITGTESYPTKTDAWTHNGFLEAEKLLYNQRMPLFESLINKLEDNEKLRNLLYSVLFNGRSILFNIDDAIINNAMMYGFIKNRSGKLTIANRIFETRLYNWFISLEQTENAIFNAGALDKPQFIENGHLNMELILERFVEHFIDLYGDHPEKFVEDEGRKYFLLFLKPIINGTGNYYIEAQTRDQKRTDVIVDYLGKRYIIELKIWRGQEYNDRGEKQLADYLEYFHVQKGYMLSFNFNQKKETGLHTIQLGDKTLVEAVV